MEVPGPFTKEGDCPSPCRAPYTRTAAHTPAPCPTAAPSEGAASSQCQTSKLTTTFGGLGPCLVAFSPCADSQARTYELLLFHGEQREEAGASVDAGGSS